MSMRPGAIVFTVIPSAPSSRASVFSQPTTPGRTAFESARFGIGSRTEEDSIATIRPRPLARRWGSAWRTSVDVGGEQERDGLLDDLGRQLGRLAGAWAAAVQDEHVDAAEGAHRHLDEALEVLRDRQVALDGERAEPLRLAFEHVAAAREHRDVRSLGGERLRGREAHAGRGAADDCRAPGESELHRRNASAGRVQGP